MIDFIVGWLRYLMYYSKFNKYLRPHIIEQINWRIEVMDRKCYESGSCIKCGCSTTAMQMANKSCDKPCYPIMLNELDWILFKDGHKIRSNNKIWSYTGRIKNGYLYHTIKRDKKIVNSKRIKV